ncbi:MAG: DNA-directed RNA polymerase subunit RPC12/RpoP [Haloarculaceae archaeon]|jgi:DNA-directed RNA polymerase subunit RPC12/RpoP
MTIETSDVACPDCESQLEVIYVTEREQVVSGWACPDCGFLASKTNRFEDSVPKPEREEYLLRIERSLTSEDVREPLGTVEDEFRALASAEMADDEVWELIDPEDGSVVDVRTGDDTEDE